MNVTDIGVFLEEEGISYSKQKLNQWIFDIIKPQSYITFDLFIKLLKTDVIKQGGIGMFGGSDNFHKLSMLQASKS
jgi:hypothetical protein